MLKPRASAPSRFLLHVRQERARRPRLRVPFRIAFIGVLCILGTGGTRPDSISISLDQQLGILRRDPAALAPHLVLGDAFFRIGNDAAARYHLERYLSRAGSGPDSMRAALLESRVLVRQGLRRRASRILARLAPREGAPPGASHDLSVLLREDGFPIEAIMAEMRAIECSRGDPFFLREGLGQWKEIGRPEEALTLCAALLRQDTVAAPSASPGRRAEDHFQWGYLNHLLDRPAEAESGYRSAAALDPGNAESHYNLALLLREAGKTDSAAVHLRRVLVLRPAYDPAYFELAGLFLEEGRRFEAEEVFRRFLLAGTDSVAKVQAAYILRSLEEPSEEEYPPDDH